MIDHPVRHVPPFHASTAVQLLAVLCPLNLGDLGVVGALAVKTHGSQSQTPIETRQYPGV